MGTSRARVATSPRLRTDIPSLRIAHLKQSQDLHSDAIHRKRDSFEGMFIYDANRSPFHLSCLTPHHSSLANQQPPKPETERTPGTPPALQSASDT